jgi:hypothetical protein
MTCEAPWWTVNLSIFPNYIKLFTIYIYIYICNIYIYNVYQPLRLYHQKRDTPELFHPKTRNSQWPQQRPTWHDWKETPITQIMTPHSSAIEFLHSYIALNAWNIKRTWLFLSNSLSLSIGIQLRSISVDILEVLDWHSSQSSFAELPHIDSLDGSVSPHSSTTLLQAPRWSKGLPKRGFYWIYSIYI